MENQRHSTLNRSKKKVFYYFNHHHHHSESAIELISRTRDEHALLHVIIAPFVSLALDKFNRLSELATRPFLVNSISKLIEIDELMAEPYRCRGSISIVSSWDFMNNSP